MNGGTIKTKTMKTLVKNSMLGLMIGGTLVAIVAGVAGMGNEALSGGILLGCAGVIKSLIS